MAGFQDFAQTLEDKIREDLDLPSERRELTDHQSYQHLGWLMGQTEKTATTISYMNSPYTKFKKPPKPRPKHVMSPSQQQAFLFLSKYSNSLAENFSVSELKKAYRQALLLVHPDKGGQAQTFWQVREAFATLKNLVN